MISQIFFNSKIFYNFSNMFFKIRNILKFGEGKNKIRNEKTNTPKMKKNRGGAPAGWSMNGHWWRGGAWQKLRGNLPSLGVEPQSPGGKIQAPATGLSMSVWTICGIFSIRALIAAKTLEIPNRFLTYGWHWWVIFVNL